MIGKFLFLVAYQLCTADALNLGRAYVSELFSAKIEPQMFNWTFGRPEQFQYRPSLKGYPDLPSWMRYTYSSEYYGGYLYGTPPLSYAGREVQIEIVGLNKLNYETKCITIQLFVDSKHQSPVNTVQMKIDNLNWVQLMDPGRVENLKNIFRNDLWPESKKDLHIVFMESAIKMGGRIPLRPQQKEGVIIHLGSTSPFSARLIDLQEEIKPLYKITTCSFKRTSVQTIIENAGFKMDWCAFRIVGNSKDLSKAHGSEKSTSLKQDRWEPMAKSEVPERNYIDELAFVIAIPGLILTLLVALLSAVLCFYHDKIHDEHSETFFRHIFQKCTDSLSDESIKGNNATVQMVQYSPDTNQPITTLKSLKEPIDDDHSSLQSQSPNNSYRVDGSPRTNSTLRPRPPPYKPNSTYKNGLTI
ncbi:hypothetical protein HA402_014814 [Bradysia odoriphaga]|nr:hypothetical protein HA402_014814 [Bradysia odoriphaga]